MRNLLALTCLAVVVSCGGDSTAPLTLSGTYNLTTVNGSALPFTAQASGPKIDILSDQIVATAGGTFTESGIYRFTSGTTVTTQPIVDAGTFTISGTAVTFTFNSDGFTMTGTLGDNSLTTTSNGFSSVYIK